MVPSLTKRIQHITFDCLEGDATREKYPSNLSDIWSIPPLCWQHGFIKMATFSFDHLKHRTPPIDPFTPFC
jgi:hypothetical protein